MEYLQNIKHVGFDLDQTLYPKSPEIDNAIQQYINKLIAEKLKCSIDEAQQKFLSYYPKISGRKTLIALGFPPYEAESIIQEALEDCDITPFLTPNPEILDLLQECKKKFMSISLITGSSESCARDKLKSLNIPVNLFDCFITGEISKSDGTAFRKWMQYFGNDDPCTFIYIGDRKVTDVQVPLSLGMQAILVYVQKEDPNLSCPQLSHVLDVRSLLLK